jgi:putative flippase GtrA
MQIARFVLVGLVTNAVYLAALAVCQFALGTMLWMGAALAYVASAVFNYMAHRRFTFRSGAGHLDALPRYAAVQGVGLAINSVMLAVLVTRLGWHFALVQVLSLIAVTAWSYAAQRIWVFAPPGAQRRH